MANKVPTLFQKRNSRTFQGLFKDKITFFKHYRIVIWCIVNALFSNEIICHKPNLQITIFAKWKTLITGSVVMGDLMTKLPNPLYSLKSNVQNAQKTNKDITFLGPLFFKSIKSNFQGKLPIFKADWKIKHYFSRQQSNSSTFQGLREPWAKVKMMACPDANRQQPTYWLYKMADILQTTYQNEWKLHVPSNL